MTKRCLLLFLLLIGTPAVGSPLQPVKTDHPRDTMRTFMEAMNDYRKGVEKNDETLQERIDDAIRTLNLDDIPVVIRRERGREAAILLKEVIDRVIVIKYDLVPDDRTLVDPWRLKDTEISIRKVTEGDRAGAFLFTRDTVGRVGEFFAKVKNLPYLQGSGKGAGYKPPWIESQVPEWAKDQTFYLHHWQWIGIFLAIFIGLLVKWITQHLVDLGKIIAAKSRHEWDDKTIEAVERPVGLITASAFWFVSLKILRLEGISLDILSITVQIIFSFAIIWLFLNLTNVLTAFLLSWTQRTEFPLDDQLLPLLNRAMRLFVAVFGVLITIQNLGVNVMSLLAGLGLGGLAFALAAKDTAANLFGSIMILWDQPFKVGDWIKVNGVEGTVEEIGFRSTRVRTFYSSQISVPNSNLANQNIDNMGRRIYRRISTVLGITYDTPPEKIEAFLEGIKKIIQANPHTVKNNFHVVFSNYGPHSLDIMLYLFLDVPDWAKELVERQNLYLEIKRLAKDIAIEFAFPTQTLHVDSLPDKQMPEKDHIPDEKLRELAKAYGPQGKSSRPEGMGIFVPRYEENQPVT